jgi:hypothetical protein
LECKQKDKKNKSSDKNYSFVANFKILAIFALSKQINHPVLMGQLEIESQTTPPK